MAVGAMTPRAIPQPSPRPSAPEPPAHTEGVPECGRGEADAEPTAPKEWTKLQHIGQGAYGSVYVGMNCQNGSLMAVKQVPINRSRSASPAVDSAIQELQREAHVLARMNHRNIVKFLGMEMLESEVNIFMELVPGGSLASLIKARAEKASTGFPEKVVRFYTRQICQGLRYLHKNHIAHRDIKGANILVDAQGTVKLADFGHSKQLNSIQSGVFGGPSGDGKRSVTGTPLFMAPEAINGFQPDDDSRPADIWSLGCTILEMYTGKAPWHSEVQSEHPWATMYQVMERIKSCGHPQLPADMSRQGVEFLKLCFKPMRSRPHCDRLLQHPWLKGLALNTAAPAAAAAAGPPLLDTMITSVQGLPSPIPEEVNTPASAQLPELSGASEPRGAALGRSPASRLSGELSPSPQRDAAAAAAAPRIRSPQRSSAGWPASPDNAGGMMSLVNPMLSMSEDLPPSPIRASSPGPHRRRG